MSHETRLIHGVMEGEGSYNRHATLPAEGAAMALPLLKKAIAEVKLDDGNEPIVIADYGSSQGKNSLVPMRAAIRGLRERIAPERSMMVLHIDQASNDFNSLFRVLTTEPESYANEAGVYPAAIGKSFYEEVLPANSVNLGWSSYAVVWLSQVPAPLPGHFIAVRCNGSARAAYDHQAARDWEHFLSLRARELRPGGRLIVVLPAITDDGVVGLEPLFDAADGALEEMVADGVLSVDERSRMALKAHPRRNRDLLAPFARNGEFRQLTVQDLQFSEVSDGAWNQYLADGDEAILASRRALFFRSVFVPSLACALNPERATSAEAVNAFSDELERRLKRHLSGHLAPMTTYAQTIVVAKKREA